MQHKSLHAGVISFLSAVVGMFSSYSTSVAQTYETLTVAPHYVVPIMTGRETKEEKAALSQQSRDAKARIKEDSDRAIELLKSNAATNETFDGFFRDFVFADMTQTGNEVLSQLGDKREEFVKRYLSPEQVGANRQHLIEGLLLPTMQKVAEGNYHPAVRLNAVLLIGLCNSTEGNSLAGELPTPNAAATKYLLSLVQKDQLPLYLVVGAYTGLHRIAQIEGVRPRLDAADVQRISDLALNVASGKSTGQDQWPRDVNYWLQRRAVQILGYLRNTGPAGEVTKALQFVLDNDKNEFLLRLDAVQSLGMLNYANASAAQVKSLSNSIVAFASYALLNHADKIRNDAQEYIALNMLSEGNFLLRSGTPQSGKKGDDVRAGMGGADGGGSEDVNQQQAAGKGGPVFDMPIYYLNLERRNCKNYTFVCWSTLGKSGKLYTLATDEERVFLERALKVLDNVLQKSDVGLVDVSKSDKGDDSSRESVSTSAAAPATEQKKGVAVQMIELFTESGTELKELVLANQVQAPAGQQDASPPANGS